MRFHIQIMRGLEPRKQLAQPARRLRSKVAHWRSLSFSITTTKRIGLQCQISTKTRSLLYPDIKPEPGGEQLQRIIIIGGAALIFGQFLNFAGLSGALVEFTESFNLGPLTLPLVICAICVVLEMIFESIGILLLIVPVFLPSLEAVAGDAAIDPDFYLVWFGIVVIIVVVLGLITPPIGINVFTVKSVIPDVELTKIFAGVVSFVFADLIVLALIFLIPGLAIFLPSVMPSF